MVTPSMLRSSSVSGFTGANPSIHKRLVIEPITSAWCSSVNSSLAGNCGATSQHHSPEPLSADSSLYSTLKLKPSSRYSTAIVAVVICFPLFGVASL